MTRSIENSKYSAWLVGYYDDWIGTQCIADDSNTFETIHNHANSHAGNPINGEAPLNPTYRFSTIDRQNALRNAAGSGDLSEALAISNYAGTSNTMYSIIHNQGIHEYITKDSNRLFGGCFYEGKATPRAPQTFFHQNRIDLGRLSSSSYTDVNLENATTITNGVGFMWINNSRSTNGKYWIPADDDGSYIRKNTKDVSATETGYLGNTIKHSEAGSHLSYTIGTSGRNERNAYLTGMFQWQAMHQDSGAVDKRDAIGQEITSLGGKPFMVFDIKNYAENRGNFAAGELPIVAYDGTLNATGDEDTFHIRMCEQSLFGGRFGFGASITGATLNQTYAPKLKLNLGFLHSDTSYSSAGVAATNPAITVVIDRYAMDITDAFANYSHLATGLSDNAGVVPKGTDYHFCVNKIGTLSGTTKEDKMNNLWYDIDVKCNFTTQKYQVYVNGIAYGALTSFQSRPGGGSWTANDFYGWELKQTRISHSPLSSQSMVGTEGCYWNHIVMIDRVSFGKYLTHPLTGETPLLNKVSTIMTSNGLSTMRADIFDDDDVLNLYPLITGTANSDYHFLLFRNGQDRPILNGIINQIRIKQQMKQQTKLIEFSISDPAKLLDKTLPVFDLGQTTLTSDLDVAAGLRGGAESLQDALYFGTVKLLVRDDNLGGNTNSNANLAFESTQDQRTCLNTAHPIQLYNNEETTGPNYPEYQWLGKKAKVIHPLKHDPGSGMAISTTVTAVAIDANDGTVIWNVSGTQAPEGLQTGDTINLFGSAVSDSTNQAVTQHIGQAAADTAENNFCITITPPTQNATSDAWIRWRHGSTHKTCIRLTAGSYTQVPSYTQATHVVVKRTDTALSQNDNKPFKILDAGYGVGVDSSNFYIWIDAEWNSFSGFATSVVGNQVPPGCTSTSNQAKVYWGNGYVDLHTADSSKSTVTTFNSVTPWTKGSVKNRAVQAVWMRDLPKSLWFQKMFGRIAETPAHTGTLQTPLPVNTYSSTFHTTGVLTTINYSDISAAMVSGGGVAELVHPNGEVDSFCFGSVTNNSTKAQLNNCKFITHNYQTNATMGGTSPTINIRTVSDDYKHIWVLWSDMRNNGDADANGMEKKNKFGLLYPTPDNYSVSLQYTDQVDIDGAAVDFVDLKVGYDCDIWEVDAEKEPYSENTWSSLGSDSHFEPAFHNWERKAGSFLIFDFSKFFNLNTEANGGKCNQITGRRKTLGDLVIDTEGHPALIDDYWQEVVTSPKNLGLARNDFSNHPSWYRFFSAGSNLAANVGTANTVAGSTTLKLEDTSEFPSEGIGMIELERKSSQGGTNERNLLFFVWFGNNTGTNTLSEVTSFDLDETTLTQDQIQTTMFREMLNFANSAAGTLAGGVNQELIYNDTINNITRGYEKIVVYSSLSAPFALRFMMKLGGYVEERDSGNWYIHDALRSMITLANSEHALSLFRLPITFSKVNIPITRRMTTTQQPVNVASRLYKNTTGGVLDWDNFGGVVDARGKSLLQAIVEITEKTRVGSEGSSTIFSYTTGKDGKLDIRPAYSAGFAFTRNNLSVSNISGSPTVTVSNVRVFYNNGSSFIDYPAGVSGTESKWKFVDVPTVRSDKEALQLAKKTYEQSKVSNVVIDAEFVTQSTETDKMLYNARFGYIADPALRTCSPVLKGAQTWTSWYNGAHYSGIQNRLDGNIAWGGSGTTAAYNTRTYGKEVTNYSADPQLHYGGACKIDTGDLNPRVNYGWIGDKSVTNAVEIVHIPKGMPKFSDAHGQELRVSIQLADYYEVSDGKDIEDMEFYLTLADVDPTFTAGATTLGSAVSNTFQPITITEATPDVKHIKFKHSGFYEIEIPAGYWAAETGSERIVVSIDCEYLRACLRHRMGEKSGSPVWGNAMQIPGAPLYGGTAHPTSAFPMGARTQPNIPMGQDTPWYHAPRIVVVDDLNFYPSTKVTYTDASLGISSPTAFSVKQVKWDANERNHDSVKLTLEKDESKALEGLAKYILPEINKGRTPGTIPTKPTPPPRTGGGGGGGGDSGYKPTVPPQVGPIGTPYSQTYQSESTQGSNIPNNPEGIRNQPGAGVDSGTTSISGQLLSQANVGINNTTADLIKRATGNMDFHGQFGNKDGEFSILGQKKKGAPAQTTRELDGIDCVWDKNRGAVFSSEGAVFPGVTSSDGSAFGQIHTHSLRASVPSDVIGKKVVLEGRVSISGLEGGSGNGASLLVKLECIETNTSVSKLVPIYAPNTADGEQGFYALTLLSCELNGANVEGNTIKATIKRQANAGYDLAQYNAVVMNNLKLKFVRSAVSGRSDSYRFLGLKNNGVRGN